MLEKIKRKPSSFPEKLIREVWEKAMHVDHNDPKQWRKDRCGNLIEFDKYEDIYSKYGWSVSYEKPLSLGGTDSIENLYPLQWEVHEQKGDTYPWECNQKPRPTGTTFD